MRARRQRTRLWRFTAGSPGARRRHGSPRRRTVAGEAAIETGRLRAGGVRRRLQVAAPLRRGRTRQERIPREYFKMAGPERDAKIWALKRQLGEDLVILGHHYQRDEVIQFADFRGDSFKLSQQAAGRADAEYILFCGVHFMAESADILSQPHQKVILPNLEAGCSMADMAKSDDVQAAWDALTASGSATSSPSPT